MQIKDEIIKYIRTNKVSTTEIADCMGKTGVYKNCKPLNRGHFSCGTIKWVYACNSSNWTIHEQITDLEPDLVVMMEAFNCEDRALIGELVTKYIILYREATALITNENLRDGNDLIKQNYPVWCKGLNPVGCFNTKTDETLYSNEIAVKKAYYDGSIAVCDDTGVVIIPKELHTEDFYKKITEIENQEDIWFEYLDRHKWNTYDIVCLKKYKENKL